MNFGDHRSNNLLKALAESKNVPFKKLLFGMGIRHVGATAAKKLTKNLGSITAIQQASVEQLTGIRSMEKRLQKVLLLSFQNSDNLHILAQLTAAEVQLSGVIQKNTVGNALSGKKFCNFGRFFKVFS